MPPFLDSRVFASACEQLDAQLKPWLLEVNCDPALGTEQALDLRVKAPMLIDALNLVGMPTPPPPPAEPAAPPSAAPTPPGKYWNLSPSKKALKVPAGPSDFERWAKAKTAETGAAAPAAAAAVAVAAEGGESARSAAERGRQRQREQWALHVVNSEFARSREGEWRRLFPSARGAEYREFFDEARRPWHFLPFDV